MQLYGRGLRRRLPSMLDGDVDRIRMVYSLLFCLPGTPVLFYGEEIGMGEELSAEGRNAVRTPMQWSDDDNGGFSKADPESLAAPVVRGEFGPSKVNVAAQLRDPDSLLSWMKLLIRRYRQCPELAWGRYEVLSHDAEQVLAHRADQDGGTVVTVHNFAGEPVEVTLELDGLEPGDRLVDLLADATTPVEDGRVTLSLGRYGCRWLRVVKPDEVFLP
jgi:maltose alpha-D-glucosyltransferase/alpha-amylase